MEDGIEQEHNINTKMGATGNPNATHLATLQERKKSIEESLAKCNQELRQLCIQEADLTGTFPVEMPLEPGESPPSIRRRIGTAFQLPESLIKNSSNKDEPLSNLELQIQLHANMAEAALGLANEQNISKTLRRQHMADYQQHKIQFTTLQEKLAFFKEQKKKKPRPEEDAVSSSASTFNKADLRHSLRSTKCPEQPETYITTHQEPFHKSPDFYVDEALNTGFYRLSLNGYKNYMEKRENLTNIHMSYNTLQYSPVMNYQQNLQRNLQHRSSQQLFNYPVNYPQSQHPLIIKNTSPNPLISRQSSPNAKVQYYHQRQFYQNPHQIQPHQQYEHNVMTSGLGGYWKRSESGEMVWCNNNNTIDTVNWQRDKRFGSLDRRKNKRLHKRMSPNVENRAATMVPVPTYTDHIRTASIKSQQAMTSRQSQDNRQLVRTQSLGSVGAQTLDSVWPSDDNSSCESDNRTDNQGSRKQKPKEWMETSLDGPVSPTHSIISRSQSTIPSILSPEEKYLSCSSSSQILPIIKPALEIPAESNPSPRNHQQQEKNVELFNNNNNNVPKNCTIVQAGHCKPYHEETKPFEMSDFYKYSTKFKKSPIKQESSDCNVNNNVTPINLNVQKNLNEHFDDLAKKKAAFNKSQPFSPCSNLDQLETSTGSLNSSLDISQITNANIAQHFSDEMNAWYKNQRLQIDNNSETSSKAKSTATLV